MELLITFCVQSVGRRDSEPTCNSIPTHIRHNTLYISLHNHQTLVLFTPLAAYVPTTPTHTYIVCTYIGNWFNKHIHNNSRAAIKIVRNLQHTHAHITHIHMNTNVRWIYSLIEWVLKAFCYPLWFPQSHLFCHCHCVLIQYSSRLNLITHAHKRFCVVWPKRLGAFKAPQRLKPTSLIGLCDMCAVCCVCMRWTSSVCRTVGKPCGCIPILERSHWPPAMDSQSTERHPLPVRFCVPLWSTQNQYFHCVHWRVPRVRSRRTVHTDYRFSKQPDHLFCMRRLFFFFHFYCPFHVLWPHPHSSTGLASDHLQYVSVLCWMLPAPELYRTGYEFIRNGKIEFNFKNKLLVGWPLG